MTGGRRGFSLIEIFFAILLVCGIFLVLATIIPTGLASVRKGQSTVVGTDLARQYMELWRATSFPTLQAQEGTPTVITFPTAPVPSGWNPGSTYTVIINVSGQPVTLDPNVIEIDVTVMWNAGGLTGSQQTQTPGGIALPGGAYANSSVTLHSQVVQVQNP